MGESDAPRLLARRSEYGYVDRPGLALTREPEAIDAEEQERQTIDARRRDRERRLDAWRPARSLIFAGLVAFQPAADSRSASDLRAIERTLRRIDQRLSAQ
jgi:hypothetical protein